jgi:large subunit ribosomal protein L24e
VIIVVKCTFCGTNIAKGTGKLFVKKDGRVLHFCTQKCETNMLVLHRRPRSVRWTADARQAKEERRHAEQSAAEGEKSSTEKTKTSKKARKAKK